LQRRAYRKIARTVLLGIHYELKDHTRPEGAEGGTRARWFVFNSSPILPDAILPEHVLKFDDVGWPDLVFGREYSDRTVKDLLALPIPRTLVVAAKFILKWLTLIDK
jgi:hypothetical protein